MGYFVSINNYKPLGHTLRKQPNKY